MGNVPSSEECPFRERPQFHPQFIIMIDLHTHLLPDWDDGAKDWDEMFRMCEIAYEDGIRKIVLTPHIHRLSKHNDDLNVLEERMTQFQERMKKNPIKFYRGAEVFLHPEMVESIEENSFSINSSNYFFIEFPSGYIPPGMRDLFFNIMLVGFIPIISHPERNSVFSERPELLHELIEGGSLAQVTAMSLTGGYGSWIRKTAHLFLRNNLVHLIASDAHDSKRRPPKLSSAVEEAGKIVGDEKAMAMATSIPQAILDNKDVPDYGEPINPVKKRRWAVRLPRMNK